MRARQATFSRQLFATEVVADVQLKQPVSHISKSLQGLLDAIQAMLQLQDSESGTAGGQIVKCNVLEKKSCDCQVQLLHLLRLCLIVL